MFEAFDLAVLLDMNAPARRDDIESVLLAHPPMVSERFAPAARMLIRTIHGLPALYNEVGLEQLEIYLGRCGATPDHLVGRFRDHLEQREHDGGVVVLACSNDRVERWESAAIRFIQGLMDRGQLCVANLATSGRGPLPRVVDVSWIYMTWRTLGGRHLRRTPSRADVRELTPDVAHALGARPSRTLENALTAVTDPEEEVEEVSWAPGHGG